MAMYSDARGHGAEDPVGNVLKWILLAVAVATFALLGWTTHLTYKAAPPFPERFVAPDESRRADQLINRNKALSNKGRSALTPTVVSNMAETRRDCGSNNENPEAGLAPGLLVTNE
jgi:hypothetical protein